jgi:hypothetical protein
MAEPMTDKDDAKQPQDGDGASKPLRKWLGMIDQYDREFDAWNQRCDKIDRIYSEERRRSGSTERHMALLWSNVSTLQPAVYAKQPEPSVNRRFKDDDPVARTACELVERCLKYTFDDNDFDANMLTVRDGLLLHGRGASWVRYEASFEPLTDENGAPLNKRGEPMGDDEDDEAKGQPLDPNPDDEQGEKVAGEEICYDYVDRKDFGHSVARTWKEVTTVWRKVYMDRDKLIDRFGEDKAKTVSLDHKRDDGQQTTPADQLDGTEAKATVYEIWDKPSQKVIFIAKAGTEILEESDPYLELKGFFPCPKPAYGTLRPRSLVPVPDYVFYQDQVEEVDELTARIGALTDQLKIVGLYSSGSGDSSAAIESIAKPGVENIMVPVPNWAQFKDGGGTKGMIEWWPVEQVIIVLKGCFETRKQLIEDIYQITGISDIMRGDGDANETASAQNLKSQWGSVRIRDRQKILAKFARDCSRIAAEIIADKFQPETLLQMSNMKLPTQAFLDQQAMMAQQQALIAQQQQAPMAPPPGAQPQPMGA